MRYKTTICTWAVQAQSRLALIVVVGRAASSAASAASATTATPTAAAAAAASEVGEPPPSLVRVRPRTECVAGVLPAPAANISRVAGTRAAGLRRSGALLQCCSLGGGFGDQVRLHPLSQLNTALDTV